MITVYTRKSLKSSSAGYLREIVAKLEFYDIPYQIKNFRDMDRDDVYYLLSLSNNGFLSLLSKDQARKINAMPVSKAVTYVLGHTTLLKSIIIAGNDKLVYRDHLENINQFKSKLFKRMRSRYNTVMAEAILNS